MEHQSIMKGIEFVAIGLEAVGVAVIAVAFVHALIRGLRHFGQKREDAYECLRIYLGRALLLGLEFLVAADIVRTVTIEPTREGLISLGMLVILRIVLGWSIAVEIEGCWPWQAAGEKRRDGGRGARGEAN